MIRPEDLTNETIHALWREAGATQAARAFGRDTPDPVIDMATCERALGDGYWPGWREVSYARERIAAALIERGSTR